MADAETICAVGTPARGEGGIGIVRMSGPRAVEIADRIFTRGAATQPTHTVRYGHIVDPASGAVLDEVLLTVMRAPRTYTREDVVEINCHGGPAPVRSVLDLLLREGARMAGSGEFTRRAFMNGRLDLAQAEAALDLIRARTAEAERLAVAQLSGRLSGRVGAIRESLVAACALMEAWLDFPEDDMEERDALDMDARVREAFSLVTALAATYSRGRLFRDGLRVAIVGRPNVGKSSLLNALLERDRAIVADLPGTTRDTIEEAMDIHGLPVRVMDTAGIRDSHEMVEREGVRRSLEALEEADLVLAVFDASAPLHAEDRTVIGKLGGRKAVAVMNKSDSPVMSAPPEGIPWVAVSALRGTGMDALRDAIRDAALAGADGGAEGVEGVMVTNARHKAALDAAAVRLGAAIEAMGAGAPLEITAMEVREALDLLGQIVGAVSTDEILNRIFSDFCIGK